MAKRILIAYYTWSGNTQKIAGLIQHDTGGITYEIQPAELYPSDYNAVVKQAKKEIQAGYKPTLKSKPDHVEPFHILFIGSPNWWSTIAPPVATFLAEHDLSGKMIAPFFTHGGGGQGRMAKDIAALCPQSTVLDSFEIYGSGSGNTQTKVSAWLRQINIL